MSDVIDFLERLGRDAKLHERSRTELDRVLDDTLIDPELHAALLARDQTRLEQLLGNGVVCCVLIPGKEQEDGEEERESEDAPAREDEPSSHRVRSFAIASRE